MGPKALPKKQKMQDKLTSSSTKKVEKIPLKRFLMQRRRIKSLLCDNDSLKDKNKEILESLQNEKMANASLRKELYHVQRLYHESLHTVNTYKVQQVETSKTLSTIARDINNMFPNILAVTDFVSGTKVKISKMLSTLPSDYISNQYSGNRNFNQSSARKSGNPMKQRVGPMVRGMLITKPKIMLERILVPPPPQDQEQTSNDMPAEEENIDLTPIQESNEPEEGSGLELGQVTVRPRRRLGWRRRSKGKLNKSREGTKEKKAPHLPVYHDDSSDSESNPARHIQPEVPYNNDTSDSESDVSHMLQNSPLVKVPRVILRADEISPSHLEQCRLPKNSISSPNDHPLEGVPGCSWMYPAYSHNSPNLNSLGNFRSSRNNERCSSSEDSLYKSQDIDENNGMAISQNRISDESVMNTLVMRNHSCVATDNHRSSVRNSSNPTQDNTLTSSPIEPDSTNNIEVTLRPSSYRKHSNGHQSLSSSIASGSESSRFSNNLVQPEQIRSINNTKVTVKIEKTSATFNSSSSPVAITSFNKRQSNNLYQRQSNSLLKRKSSFIDNANSEPSPLIVTGKRVRKPKNYNYPGEESSPPPKMKRKKQEKGDVKRPSISEKQNPKGKTGLGARKSRDSGENRKSITNSAKVSTNNVTNRRKTNTNTTNKPSKKSSIKLSIHTPRNSTEETHQVSASESSRQSSRPQRRKAPVSYKESPLNTKQRRP